MGDAEQVMDRLFNTVKEKLIKKRGFPQKIYFILQYPNSPSPVWFPVPAHDFFNGESILNKKMLPNFVQFCWDEKKMVTDVKIELLKVIIISEMWYAEHEVTPEELEKVKSQPLSETEKKYALPSKDPKRKEGLLFIISDKNTVKAEMIPFENKNGKITFLDWLGVPSDYIPATWVKNVFPKNL